MAWLDAQQLKQFKRVGRGVKISSDARIFGPQNIEVGDNVRIDAQTTILAGKGSLKIGSHVHVAVGCVLACGGGILIGDFAAISMGSVLISASDDASGEYLVGPQFPEFLRKVTAKRIVIGDHAFLGAGVTVLVGATVEQGAMLGANSTLFSERTAYKWKIHTGTPAVPIKDRKQDCIKKSIEMLQWWDQNAP